MDLSLISLKIFPFYWCTHTLYYNSVKLKFCLKSIIVILLIFSLYPRFSPTLYVFSEKVNLKYRTFKSLPTTYEKNIQNLLYDYMEHCIYSNQDIIEESQQIHHLYQVILIAIIMIIQLINKLIPILHQKISILML